MRDGHRVTFRHDRGTGHGDDQSLWACTCGFLTLSESSAVQHRDQAARWAS